MKQVVLVFPFQILLVLLILISIQKIIELDFIIVLQIGFKYLLKRNLIKLILAFFIYIFPKKKMMKLNFICNCAANWINMFVIKKFNKINP